MVVPFGRGETFAVGLALATGCLTKSNPIWQDSGADSGSTSQETSSGTMPTSAGASASSDGTSTTTSAGASAPGSGTGGSTGTDQTTGGSSTGERGLSGCEGEVILEASFTELPLSSMVWDVFVDPGADAALVDEQLHVTVDDATNGAITAYWIAASKQALPSAGTFGLELVEVPDAAVSGQVYLAFTNVDTKLYFDLNGGEIRVMRNVGGEFTYYAWQGFDPVAHRFIRVVYDLPADTVVFETSADADTWQEFATLPASNFPLDGAVLEFGIGAWQGPVTADPLGAVDNVFLCGAR